MKLLHEGPFIYNAGSNEYIIYVNMYIYTAKLFNYLICGLYLYMRLYIMDIHVCIRI